jgi:drug/metabolite transporter (DMT)-like permease
MNRITTWLITGCVTLETAEHALYRAGARSRAGRRIALIGGGVALNLGGLALWYALIRTMKIGVAAPLVGAAGYVTIALAGRVFFHERVGVRRWAGIGIILIGLALIARWGQETPWR